MHQLAADEATDLKRLQGLWHGKGPGGPCSVTISGHTLRYEQPTKANGDEFWYETTFTLHAEAEYEQFHATIVKNSSEGEPHIGTVVVTLYKFEDEKLTLGITKSFEEPPSEPVAESWEWIVDIYELERASESGQIAE